MPRFKVPEMTREQVERRSPREPMERVCKECCQRYSLHGWQESVDGKGWTSYWVYSHRLGGEVEIKFCPRCSATVGDRMLSLRAQQYVEAVDFYFLNPEDDDE